MRRSLPLGPRPRSCILLLLLVGLAAIVPTRAPLAQGFHAVYGVQNRDGAGEPQQLFQIDVAQGYRINEQPLGASIPTIHGMAGLERDGYGTAENAENVWVFLHLPELLWGTPEEIGPIGFPEVHGLARCQSGPTFYGASFDDGTNRTTLITIDPTTGAGTAVGTTSVDVWIVGLACDGSILYGISRPIGTNPTQKLYRLDTATGAETLVGELGIAEILEGLTIPQMYWMRSGSSGRGTGGGSPLVGAFEHLYLINSETGAATLVGGDFTGGTPGDGIYGLGGELLVDPVRETSWGRIKDVYR